MAKKNAQQREQWAAAAQARSKELAATLEREVAAIQSSVEFKRYLAVAARFHKYSFNNILLIMAQRPDATRVAGYTTWQKLGRQVRKGEKGIAIFAPHTYKTEDRQTKEERMLVGFHIEHVFDISQTDGPELPSFEVKPLTGSEGAELYDALAVHATALGLTVTHEDPLTGGDDSRSSYLGYYEPARKRIFVKRGAAIQMTKTLVHELAHHLDDELAQSTAEERETVAEGSAYMVLAHFGLDTGAYSFRYIAVWAGQKDGVVILRKVLERIQRISRGLIEAIDEQVESVRYAA